MSQENVEIVRRALEAFARGGLDAALSFYDPDVTWAVAEDESEAAADEFGALGLAWPASGSGDCETGATDGFEYAVVLQLAISAGDGVRIDQQCWRARVHHKAVAKCSHLTISRHRDCPSSRGCGRIDIAAMNARPKIVPM